MDFNYTSYRAFLALLVDNGYVVTNYHDYAQQERLVILRHDIDQSIEKAVKLGEIEQEKGVFSTYFVLLNSDFYNIASPRNQRALQCLLRQGHEIGLHFDEKNYETTVDVPSAVLKEADILEKLCGAPITTVSMHRPSVKTLEADYKIPGMVNSYGTTFFKDFKYLSDSRRSWREPVLDIIRSGEYAHLHILTHPFWYGTKIQSMKETVATFVNHANQERYESMMDNIYDLPSIMAESEVLK